MGLFRCQESLMWSRGTRRRQAGRPSNSGLGQNEKRTVVPIITGIHLAFCIPGPKECAEDSHEYLLCPLQRTSKFNFEGQLPAALSPRAC